MMSMGVPQGPLGRIRPDYGAVFKTFDKGRPCGGVELLFGDLPSVHIPKLAQRRLVASKNLRTDSDTSSYSTKRRRSSSATSTVTSRDQPSAVLKATIRTGLSYWPSSIFRTIHARLVPASSVSRHTLPREPKSSSTR